MGRSAGTCACPRWLASLGSCTIFRCELLPNPLKHMPASAPQLLLWPMFQCWLLRTNCHHSFDSLLGDMHGKLSQSNQSSRCRARRLICFMRCRGAPAGGKGRVACTGRAGAISGCRGSPQAAEPPGRAPRFALTATLAGGPQCWVVPSILLPA